VRGSGHLADIAQRKIARGRGQPRRFAPTVRRIRIVVSDCRGQRVRLREVEEELEGAPLPDRRRIEELVGRALEPRADIHASAEYKRYMTGVLVADTLHALTLEGTT